MVSSKFENHFEIEYFCPWIVHLDVSEGRRYAFVWSDCMKSVILLSSRRDSYIVQGPPNSTDSVQNEFNKNAYFKDQNTLLTLKK